MKIAAVVLVAISWPALAAEYVVTTLAGDGAEGFAGDGGGALCATLNRPTGVDVDARGFVYIADYSNHRIRRVAPDGTITTVAGTGAQGFSGDGGAATLAQLSGPYGVRVIDDGFLIADAQNGRIRHVDVAGIIRTIAGGGSGHGRDIGDGGRATDATLRHPTDVIRGPEEALFISEGGGNRIRRVAADGTITTWAGSGVLRYNGASGRAGDGGAAASAQLNVPAALAFDAKGNMYIADLRNHVVRRVSPDGIIQTIAGTGVAGNAGEGEDALSAQLNEPGGFAFEPDGSLLISELTRIVRVTPEGKLVRVAGSEKRGFYGDHGLAAKSEFAVLDLMARDAAGNLFVADHRNSRIRKLSPVMEAGTSAPPTHVRAAQEVEQLLAKMRAAYESITSADIAFESRRGEQSLKGSFNYRSPSTIDATLDVERYGRVLVTSDGKTIRVTDPMLDAPEERAWSVQNMRNAAGAGLEVISLWDWKRQLSTEPGANMRAADLSLGDPESWRGRRWIVLHEQAGGDLYRYFVDSRTYLMWRTVITREGTVVYDGAVLRLSAKPR
ncbi:MAG: hypothetical protein JJE51_07010 [Thermoanaerobaculia bacterium]|nr:hypothetical protein [Thermoanaerobaculia bacterium]